MKKLVPILAISVLIAIGCESAHKGTLRSEFAVNYQSRLYGLTFHLPPGWRGFTVSTQEWEGISYIPAKDTTEVTARGPLIVLRHPRSTSKVPYQDIPILVFTRRQWEADKQGRFAIGAGGFDEEIRHNSNYVFAISSRYNADDSVRGWKETSDVVERNRTERPHLHPE